MHEITKLLVTERENLVKVTASDRAKNDYQYKKSIIRPVVIKNKRVWQVERFKDNKAFHTNLDDDSLDQLLFSELLNAYNQIDVCLTQKNITFFLKNGRITKRKEVNSSREKQSEAHDRDKNFLLKEGEPVPALVDLGVFTSDYKIVKNMYDKYKQINRFMEMIDDKFKKFNKEHVTVLDFGCGKSYLTFIVYYYFVHIKKINATVIGYDLKEDVVKNCNDIAQKYGYSNLHFYVNDVTKPLPFENNIDAVISLHACDIATDYAIDYAINHRVKFLFSVPCCQHEVNLSIKHANQPKTTQRKATKPQEPQPDNHPQQAEGDFNLLLNYGLIKERFSALLTDCVRAHILEDFGYTVDVNEFVDFEHSPKNVMIRAELIKEPNFSNRNELLRLKEKYGFNQRLIELEYFKK